MIHLANFIKIVPLHQYVSYSSGVITANVEVLLLLSESDIKLQETPEPTGAGTKYKQSFTIVSEKLSEAIRAMYPPNIPVMVILYTDDQQPYLLGNSEQRLRLTITPGPDSDLLSFYRETTTPLF